ncbi:MAG: NfeD family protein [Janthinobacterium lividum]
MTDFSLNGGAVWLIAGLLLAAQELILPGVFLLWIGLAAIAAGLLTVAIGLTLHWQIAAFIVLAIALVALAALRRRPVPDTLNGPSTGLIGTTCYALAFDAGEGRVRYRDGTWQARITDGAIPSANEPLKITGLDGTILLVSRP